MIPSVAIEQNKTRSYVLVSYFIIFLENTEKSKRSTKHMNRPKQKTSLHRILVGTIQWLVEPRKTTRN